MSFSAQYPPVLTEAGDLTSEVLAKYNQEFQYLYTNLLSALFSATTGHAHTGNGSDGMQIDTTGLADNAVTTVKITDANVTTAKIANGAITQEKLDADINSATSEKVNHSFTVMGNAFDGSAAITIEKATQEQAEAGTDDASIMTALRTVQAIKANGGSVESSSFSATASYIKLSCGLIVQWGNTAALATSITLPIPFSNSNYFFSGTITEPVTTGGVNLHGVRSAGSILLYCAYSNSSATFQNWNWPATWIAIGC